MRGFIPLVVLGTFCAAITAQTAPNSPLSAYVGTYVDRPGHTLEIVAGDQLFAVQDEAKYLLRPSGIDQFTTIGGQRVEFPRDATGKVTGYQQDRAFHERVSLAVTPESAALARPRPEGQNSPSDYHYHAPVDLNDESKLETLLKSDLGEATAIAIVRGNPRWHVSRCR